MPSPSGFLADVVYSGGGYSALGTDGEDGGGFSWPTASTSAARDGEEEGAKRGGGGGGYRPAPMLAEEEGRDLFGPGPAASEDAVGEEQMSERDTRRLKRGSQSSMSGVDDEGGVEDEQEEDAGKGKRTRTR